MSKGVLYDGHWFYALPEEKGARYDVVVRLCFAPLETDIWGIKDGLFFHENHKIEGIDAALNFQEVSQDEFYQALNDVIELSRSNNWKVLYEKLLDTKDDILACC